MKVLRTSLVSGKFFQSGQFFRGVSLSVRSRDKYDQDSDF